MLQLCSRIKKIISILYIRCILETIFAFEKHA
uniref:Uncharacterized protein n=1 Tax=Anguilla anguilla TaxID=7936 RepID=A0A0E9SIA8_ANGAN